MAGTDHVNEGQLHFLATPPAKPVHHHQNRIRISAASLASGWVELAQCHDHLDPVARAEITFRDGRVRDLRIVSADRIGAAWVEGPSVQLQDVARGARLCLAAQTRALQAGGDGSVNLGNGPYMRRFLDGFYPMRVTLNVDYPPDALQLVDVDPPPQPGLAMRTRPGEVRLDAWFEGELNVRMRFDRR